MSENLAASPQETAIQKMERLKIQIAQKLKERSAAMAPQGNESVEKAEAVLAMVRARLMSGQAAVNGRFAVQKWMDTDRETGR
jgi:hypothetical protein